jgi:hypothetical protein
MHTPIVVFAILASGSICHHWQSLHRRQLDAATATAPLENSTPKTAESGRDKATCSERFLYAEYSPPPHPDSYFMTILRQHPYRRCRLTGYYGCVTGIDLREHCQMNY